MTHRIVHFSERIGLFDFAPKQAAPDPFFGGLTTRILKDESRHLAFAEHYLKRNLPKLVPERRRVMIEMRDELLRLLESMTERVRADAEAFDVEIEGFLEGVSEELEGVAKRIGLVNRDGGPPRSGAPSVAIPSGSVSVDSAVSTDDNFVARCFGCLLTLICNRQLAST